MQIIPTKTPKVLKRLLPQYCWDMQTHGEKKIYLTFDDGPIPKVTEFVLDQLSQYNAKATFFCIGANIEKHPTIFQRIYTEGHTLANHTQNHCKAWKTNTETYLKSIQECEERLQKYRSNSEPHRLLFRPPYGQISWTKTKAIQQLGYTIVLWDVLAKDWMQTISPEACVKNIIANTVAGSIIVFHDSHKAWTNMSYALPKVLEYFSEKGYQFSAL